MSKEESIIASDVSASSARIDASKENSLFSSFLDEILKVPRVREEGVSEQLAEFYVKIENFPSVNSRLALNSDIQVFIHQMKFKSPKLSGWPHRLLRCQWRGSFQPLTTF